MKTRSVLLCVLACLWSLSAMAQWQWIEKDGRKVFSDRPPPADIPEKSILKRPAGGAALAAPSAAANTEQTATPPKPLAPKNLQDNELEEKKRQADAAQAAKLKAAEEKLARARADNCARARQFKATLDSGMRMARVNEKGERIVLDDDARAAENARTQEIINSDCAGTQ